VIFVTSRAPIWHDLAMLMGVIGVYPGTSEERMKKPFLEYRKIDAQTQ